MQTINTDTYNVTIVEAPLPQQYWHKGQTATVKGNQIQINNIWFNFTAGYVVQKQK